MQDDRKTIREISPVFAFIFLILYLWKGIWIFIYISLFFLLLNVFFPFLDRLISQWWLKFTEFIARWVINAILTIIWFLILTPLGFMWRRGKNYLWLKKPSLHTYWIDGRKIYRPEDMEKTW